MSELVKFFIQNHYFHSFLIHVSGNLEFKIHAHAQTLLHISLTRAKAKKIQVMFFLVRAAPHLVILSFRQNA